MIINGFLVVRKPHACFREIKGRGKIFYSVSIGSKTYEGVERLQWETISNMFLDNNLHSSEHEFYKLIDFGSSHGLKVISNFEDAFKILSLSNRTSDDNEIIAVYSKQLSELYPPQKPKNLEGDLAGMDVWCDGYGSLIFEGYFRKPGMFEGISSQLNSSGLFDIEKAAYEYIDTYQAVSSTSNSLEQIGDLDIEVIRVWRLHVKNQEPSTV